MCVAERIADLARGSSCCSSLCCGNRHTFGWSHEYGPGESKVRAARLKEGSKGIKCEGGQQV